MNKNVIVKPGTELLVGGLDAAKIEAEGFPIHFICTVCGTHGDEFRLFPGVPVVRYCTCGGRMEVEMKRYG